MVGATPSQTVGPYFSIGLSEPPQGELVTPGADGAVRISGRVLDGAGDPVTDGVVEIWQADARGAYRGDSGFGRCALDGQGRFSFLTVKPGPVDGQAPHLTVFVFARGLLKHLHTRLYFPDEGDANAVDPVLSGVPAADRETMIAVAEDGGLGFQIRLQGEGQTLFFAL